MTYPTAGLYIDGEWTDGTDGRGDDIVNPATGQVLGRVPFAGPDDVDRAIGAAGAAFPAWRDAGPERRGAILRRAAALIHERAAEIGRAMTLEEGKPLAEATGEAHRAATQLEVYCEEARRAYGRIIPTDPGQVLSVRTSPVGPVGAFVPWNFPAGGPMRKIAAALAAGCSIVIKPSEETPGTTCLMARAFADAGLPAGVLNVLFGVPDEISRRVIASPVIRYVAFTGSVPVGKHVAGLAAAAMKASTMELGGHAPVIVCADADPVAAARLSVTAKFRNAGQVCASPIRFLIERTRYREFRDAFVAEASALKVGPGLDPASQLGPLIHERRVAEMEQFVADAAAQGARLLCGGARLPRPGYFFAPTVIESAPPAARVQREEPFGPIALLDPYDTLEEAIARANALRYGLAAYAFTSDLRIAHRLGSELQAGMVGINHFGISQPETPFGGVKDSGSGQESGLEGLLAYTDVKLVSVAS
jgi:succinate-semialdehyde dehydrogenase / glutarate-semialdehyde dehydrogenase